MSSVRRPSEAPCPPADGDEWRSGSHTPPASDAGPWSGSGRSYTQTRPVLLVSGGTKHNRVEVTQKQRFSLLLACELTTLSLISIEVKSDCLFKSCSDSYLWSVLVWVTWRLHTQQTHFKEDSAPNPGLFNPVVIKVISVRLFLQLFLTHAVLMMSSTALLVTDTHARQTATTSGVRRNQWRWWSWFRVIKGTHTHTQVKMQPIKSQKC